MLTNFVDVEFWQNFDVECRQKAGQIGDLLFEQHKYYRMCFDIYVTFVDMQMHTSCVIWGHMLKQVDTLHLNLR